MVKLKLNGPKGPPPAPRTHEEIAQANTALEAAIKARAAQQAFSNHFEGQPNGILARDATATNQQVAKNGPSKKRKADDEDVPAATRPRRKKEQKNFASVNNFSGAMQDELDRPRESSYSPGFVKRRSPERRRDRKTRWRGRSKTPCPATAAIPIYMDLEARRQSHEEQLSVSEAAASAPAVAAAKEQESTAIDVAARQGDTVLPSLDKENVGVEKTRRRTKKAAGRGSKAKKDLDLPKEQQGKKRSAEDDSGDDEASHPSQHVAKKPKLKIVIIRRQKPETAAEANDQDATEEEESIPEITQEPKPKPEPRKKKPAPKKNGPKGKANAKSSQSNTRSDGKPKLAWRASSSTPPPQLGRPLTARQLAKAREKEEKNPTEQQPFMKKYMAERGIDPDGFWDFMRTLDESAGDKTESKDPEMVEKSG